MTTPVADIYLELMQGVRERLDIIGVLVASNGLSQARCEAAAFQGRKVAEGIAFGCLVATENGLGLIPRDVKGQWNAEKIVETLSRKQIRTFPSPSAIRKATDEERRRFEVSVVHEGIPANRLSVEEFVAIYQRLHAWLHEMNPYVHPSRSEFLNRHSPQLWKDLQSLEKLVERHIISIAGEAFACTLRDRVDGTTKVLSLSKISDLPDPELIGA